MRLNFICFGGISEMVFYGAGFDKIMQREIFFFLFFKFCAQCVVLKHEGLVNQHQLVLAAVIVLINVGVSSGVLWDEGVSTHTVAAAREYKKKVDL